MELNSMPTWEGYRVLELAPEVTACWHLLTFVTVDWIVSRMPPEGSSAGKSNELIVTPFCNPLNPLRAIILDGNEIPGT